MKTIRLTVPQQRAVAKLSFSVWRTAYSIKESVSTLKALVRMGMVRYRTKSEVFYKLAKG